MSESTKTLPLRRADGRRSYLGLAVSILVLAACSGDDGSSSRAAGDALNRNNSGSGSDAANGSAGTVVPLTTEDLGEVEVTQAGPAAEPVCSDATIEPVAEGGPGNLLVIFDRSGSMDMEFQGGQSRLEAVDGALMLAVEPFICGVNVADGATCVEQLHVASLLFPSEDPGVVMEGGGRGGRGDRVCRVDPLAAETQIPWQLASSFVNSWEEYWSGPNGHTTSSGTPIPAAFAQAETALNGDLPEGTTTVLFLTDGESNCDTGVDPVQQAAAWLDRGIRTYVVSVAEGNDTFNNAVAQAGGTEMALNPADPTELTDTLRHIISLAIAPVDCMIELTGDGILNEELACEEGEVLVGPSLLDCDPDDGFQIRGPHMLEIMGSACERLKQGDQRLIATFPCEVALE